MSPILTLNLINVNWHFLKTFYNVRVIILLFNFNQLNFKPLWFKLSVSNNVYMLSKISKYVNVYANLLNKL